jgi:hypothetical protein
VIFAMWPSGTPSLGVMQKGGGYVSVTVLNQWHHASEIGMIGMTD